MIVTLPANIYRYVWQESRWHQLVLVGLTACVSLLEVAPLELQRRIVNDVVKHRQYWLIITLCGVYFGAVLIQGGTKLVLNIYRNWVGESAVRDLRRRVRRQDCPFERLEQWATALVARKRLSKPPIDHAGALDRAAPTASRRTSAVVTCRI